MRFPKRTRYGSGLVSARPYPRLCVRFAESAIFGLFWVSRIFSFVCFMSSFLHNHFLTFNCILTGAQMGELASAHYRFRSTKKTFHVDIDSKVPGANVRGAIPVVTYCKAFLSALAKELRIRSTAEMRTRAQRNVALLREGHAALRKVVASERESVRSSGNWIVSQSEKQDRKVHHRRHDLSNFQKHSSVHHRLPLQSLKSSTMPSNLQRGQPTVATE